MVLMHFYVHAYLKAIAYIEQYNFMWVLHHAYKI